MQSITAVTAYPEPPEMQELGFLGQYHHGSPHASITRGDIEAEMASRGYEIERHHVAPEPHPTPVPGRPITREQAISIACDVAIAAYNIDHTSGHPYWCPTGTCQISASVWNTMLDYAVTLANGFYTGAYGLPDWAYHTSFSGLGELGAVDTVTAEEMSDELQSRGFRIESVHHAPPVHHHVPHEEVGLTKAAAIGIACDVSIAAYSLPHTSTHPYRYSGSGYWAISKTTWEYVVDYGIRLAEGYLAGEYRMPDWSWSEYIHHSYYQAGGSKHRAYDGLYGFDGFGALDGWIQDNPWVITAIIGVLKAYGDYLTAKQVEKAIKDSIPANLLSQEDLPALIAAIQAGMPPNQAGVIAAGADKAVMGSPNWLIPVLVGGGVLMAVIMLKK